MENLQDISNVSFNKSMVFGYKTDEVDQFVTDALEIIEKQQNEILDLKKAMEDNAEAIKKYKEEEESLQAALLGAQKLSSTIMKDARLKAEQMEKDAISQRNKILEAAHIEKVREQDALDHVRQEAADFKDSLINLYRSHLDLIKNIPGEGGSRSLNRQQPAPQRTEQLPQEPQYAPPAPEYSEAPPAQEYSEPPVDNNSFANGNGYTEGYGEQNNYPSEEPGAENTAPVDEVHFDLAEDEDEFYGDIDTGAEDNIFQNAVPTEPSTKLNVNNNFDFFSEDDEEETTYNSKPDTSLFEPAAETVPPAPQPAPRPATPRPAVQPAQQPAMARPTSQPPQPQQVAPRPTAQQPAQQPAQSSNNGQKGLTSARFGALKFGDNYDMNND